MWERNGNKWRQQKVKNQKKKNKEQEKNNENGKKHVKDHFKRRILGKDEKQKKNKYKTMIENFKLCKEMRKNEIKV